MYPVSCCILVYPCQNREFALVPKIAAWWITCSFLLAHIARNKDGRFQNREAGEDIEYYDERVVDDDGGDDVDHGDDGDNGDYGDDDGENGGNADDDDGENGGNADDDDDDGGDVNYGNNDHDDDGGEDGDEKEGVVSPHVSSVNSTNKYPLPSFWAVMMLIRIQS